MTVPSRGARAELFAKVYADPGNDELRAIVADRLEEIGDPRGELIALQLEASRKKLSGRQARRLDELLDSEWRTFEAEVPGARRVDAAKGFPARAWFAKSPRATPSLATLTFVELDAAVDDVAWLSRLPILHTLSVESFETFGRISALPPLDHVETVKIGGGTPGAVVELLDGRLFPRLRRLAMHWFEGEPTLFEAAARANVDLELGASTPRIGEFSSALLASPRSAGTVELRLDHYRATFTAGCDGWRFELSTDYFAGSVRAIRNLLGALPAKSVLAATAPKSDAREIRTALARVIR